MSIGSVIKRVAHGVGNELRSAVQPQAEPPINAQLPPDAAIPQYQPMELPEIDPKDPEAASKQQIHDYIRALEKAHAEYAASQPDYHQQYQQLADYVNSGPAPKRFDPLSAFAIGMGDINNLKQVADVNAAADKERHAKEDYLLNLREQAMKGNIQRLMEEGKFQQALKESAALQTLNAEQEAAKEKRTAKQRLAEIEAQNTGRANVAHIRADSVIKAAQTHAQNLGSHLNLKKDLIKAKTAEAVAEIRGIMSSKDMMGQANWDPEAVRAVQSRLDDELDALAGDPANLETKESGKPEVGSESVKMRFPDNKVRSVAPEKVDAAVKAGAVRI